MEKLEDVDVVDEKQDEIPKWQKFGFANWQEYDDACAAWEDEQWMNRMEDEAELRSQNY